jgi:hypothetical protein
MLQVSSVRSVKAARKSYHCDWCYERIETGKSYQTWFTYGEAVTARMHPECFAAMQKADIDKELPPAGTYRRGCWCGEREEHCNCIRTVRGGEDANTGRSDETRNAVQASRSALADAEETP